MTAKRSRAPLVGLSVGQRLLLGLAPALLAVALVPVLAYYGEFGRSAPGYVVSGAAVLAAVSLWLTWANTRYLALRIRRLAGGVHAAGDETAPEDDELGRIEQVVDRLGAALSESESERRHLKADNDRRLHEQATILGATVRDALARLDDVRLPLHILVDAPFGDLNENQEELIATARAASDAMDEVLRRLTTICDVDRGAISVLLERVSVNEVIRGVLPMLHASAERRGLRIDVALDPALPRVPADRARLAEALALLGNEAAWTGEDGTELAIRTGIRDGHAWVSLSPMRTGDDAITPDHVVATRLIEAQGGTVVTSGTTIEIRLPANRSTV